MIMAISVACVLSDIFFFYYFLRLGVIGSYDRSYFCGLCTVCHVFFLFLLVSLVAMICDRSYYCGLCIVCHGLSALPLGVVGRL